MKSCGLNSLGISRREGYPDRRTIDYWTGGDNSERFVQSRTTVNHNKAAGFERRLEVCSPFTLRVLSCTSSHPDEFFILVVPCGELQTLFRHGFIRLLHPDHASRDAGECLSPVEEELDG